MIAIKKVFPYYYDIVDHIKIPAHQQQKEQGGKGVMIPSSDIESEALVPSSSSSSFKEAETRASRQLSPSSLPPSPPRIVIPYRHMPSIMTTSKQEEEQDNDNTQSHGNEEYMKREMMQLIQKNSDFILSVSRTQEMQAKASLIRTMRASGCSKDEIMAMLNTM